MQMIFSAPSARCLFATVFVFFLWTGQSQARFTICNQSDSTIVVAGVEEKELLITNWTSGGWFEFKPNECDDLIWYRGPHRIYLTIRRLGQNGEGRLMLHEPGKRSTNQRTVEEFFCVSEQPFNRNNLSLSEHRKCPEGSRWFLHLFNLYFDIPGNTNFTLNVE